MRSVLNASAGVGGEDRDGWGRWRWQDGNPKEKREERRRSRSSDSCGMTDPCARVYVRIQTHDETHQERD